MSIGNEHEQALAVFNALRANLDAHHWKYHADEEALTIESGAQGEDLPMELRIEVEERRKLVILLSHQPFIVPEEKRMDMAVAVSVINNRLVDGCFDFDFASGHMFFRMTHCYIDSILGDALFSYMIGCSLKTIDDFNDKFMMLSTGIVSIEQFIKLVNN